VLTRRQAGMTLFGKLAHCAAPESTVNVCNGTNAWPEPEQAGGVSGGYTSPRVRVTGRLSAPIELLMTQAMRVLQLLALTSVFRGGVPETNPES